MKKNQRLQVKLIQFLKINSNDKELSEIYNETCKEKMMIIL